MPYQNWDDVNPAIKGIDPRPSLAQARMIAGWADRIEQKGEAENAWAAAIALFKKTHHVEGGKWVKNEGSTAEHTEDLLDFLCDIFRDEEQEMMEEIGLAYVVDLMAELPRDAQGQVDFSQPFRILPVGKFHRRGSARSVTEADVDQFADNWAHREMRGIRRKHVLIDLEHEPGGVGEYAHIYSRGAEGLWAQVELSTKGRKALQERDFLYFSPTVAWRSQDRKTGEIVTNQIVGGALTNYPFFGDETALPILGYSETALFRLWEDGHAIEGYATKREDGVEYPASAYLIVDDPQKPTSWHLRVKEYVDGKLIYTKNMCGRAAASLNPEKPYRGRPYQGPRKAEAKTKLRGIYLNQLKVPREEVPPHLFSEGGQTMTTEFTKEEHGTLQRIAALFSSILPKLEGGDTMPNKGDDKDKAVQISPEAFAEMQSQLAKLTDQVESLSQERDDLKQQVKTGQEQLAAETYARLLQEMKVHVQQFARLALPIELPDGAPDDSLTAQEHFVWLQTVDATKEKTHWAFFNEVLKAADAALKEAGVLEELGTRGGADELMDEDEKLHQQAVAYAEKHKVGYTTALKAVAGGATVPESS